MTNIIRNALLYNHLASKIREKSLRFFQKNAAKYV